MGNRDVKSIVISVLIVATSISTSSTSSVIAQEVTSKTATSAAHQLIPLLCNSPNQIMYHTDAKHQFEIACNSTQLPHYRWNVTVYVKAPPQVLGIIQKVNYLAYPKFGPDKNSRQHNITGMIFYTHTPPPPENGTLSENITQLFSDNESFPLVMPSVSGGPKINATVFFNGNLVKHYRPLQTIVQCVSQACPIVFTVNPIPIGQNTLKIDGTGDKRNIASISVAWGDGKPDSIAPYFPLNHTYSKPGPYSVTITAINNQGIKISQQIQTSTLVLQRSVPKVSSLGVKGIFAVNASTSYSSISEDSSYPFTVWGRLFYSTNGTGIRKQPVDIIFLDDANHQARLRAPAIRTDDNGNYSQTYPNLNLLSHGEYKVLVQVANHQGLNATIGLIVIARQITPEQLNTGIAIIVGVIGVITGMTKVRDYFNGKKQANYLSKYMQQIKLSY